MGELHVARRIEDDGVIGRLERTRQLFGRALDMHTDAERSRVRHDDLMD